jgi:hypothetical protein
MFNTSHFNSYCNYICNNIDFKEKLKIEEDYLEAIRDYCNNFSSFLLIKKNSIDDIKNYRKNVIIDYYSTTYKVPDKEELNNYYLTNINDTYNMKFNPPASYKFYLDIQEIEKNDDVNDHYDNINKMTEYYGRRSLINTTEVDDDLNYAFNDEDTISVVSSRDDYYDEYEEYDDYIEFYDEEEEYYSDDYDY